MCFLLSFGPKARFITACKDYLFNRPKPIELKLIEWGENINFLRSSGFKESYIRGLDKVREHLRLAHKLRTGSINPWKTHIEEFATLVKPHLDYVERGIRSQDSADKLERLAILEDFRAETQSWLEKREVSYRRWVNLNFRLSILVTPKDKRLMTTDEDRFLGALHASEDWHTDKRLESLYQQWKTKDRNLEPIVLIIDDFPEVIIVPQMDGITGIMALTRMAGRRVYLHALENKASHIHYNLRYPDWAFQHDSEHTIVREIQLSTWIPWREGSYETVVTPFHNAFLLRMQEFPKKEREMLELVYHYLVFERPLYGNIFNYPRTSVYGVVHRSAWVSDLETESAILPDWVENNSVLDVKAFLKEATNLYEKTAWEVFNSL